MKFLYPINLTKNEIQNAVIQNLATAPEKPKKGQLYFDTGEDDLKIFNGVTWLSALEPGTKINDETGELTLVGGDRITLVKEGKTFKVNHDKIANSDLAASGRRYVTGLTFDDYGHVTGFTTGTETVEDTTYTAGTKLTLDKTTFNHDLTSRTDTTDTGNSGFGGTISVVDSVSSDSTGHLTAINTKTITLPSETELSLDVTGSGNFISAQSVDNHEISLTKTNTTEDKITVGELLVSKSGNGTGNVVIQGDLTVEGNTTTISTSELKVEDNVITLNSGATTAALNAGIEVNRGTKPNYEITFVEASEDFRIGQTGDLQPVLTRDEISGLTNLDLLTWDSTNQKAVGKTPSELGITRKYATDQAIARDTNYTITHNLGTTDVSVSLKDSTTGEFIFADVKTIDNNSIEIGFGEINSVTNVRVIVIG